MNRIPYYYFSLFLLMSFTSLAQFTTIVQHDGTSIKNQQKTGTCWSFSTVSFLESEIIRLGGPELDLSEMYIVSKIYEDKALNYILRQGTAQFSQGSLAHDMLSAYDRFGIVPESVFSGRADEEKAYNHSQLLEGLSKVVKKAVSDQQAPKDWLAAFRAVLAEEGMYYDDQYFYLNDIEWTPESFARALPLDPDDYMHFTSFTHHPFYERFVLEIPDNFSNGSYQNVPMQELLEITHYALDHGMTLTWDGDVSEDGFDAQKGWAKYEGPEISQIQRQKEFLTLTTTDDHLMHLVGKATDEEGHGYFIIKNSWGPIGPFEGYLYMSEEYFLMKTVGLTVHKEGVPQRILNNIK